MAKDLEELKRMGLFFLLLGSNLKALAVMKDSSLFEVTDVITRSSIELSADIDGDNKLLNK